MLERKRKEAEEKKMKEIICESRTLQEDETGNMNGTIVKEHIDVVNASKPQTNSLEHCNENIEPKGERS